MSDLLDKTLTYIFYPAFLPGIIPVHRTYIDFLLYNSENLGCYTALLAVKSDMSIGEQCHLPAKSALVKK